MMFLDDVMGYIQGSESESKQSWLANFLQWPISVSDNTFQDKFYHYSIAKKR